MKVGGALIVVGLVGAFGVASGPGPRPTGAWVAPATTASAQATTTAEPSVGAGTPTAAADPGPTITTPARPRRVPLGAFLGSDSDGVDAIAGFEAWLGTAVTVGHTYLPGNHWADIRGGDWVLDPWTEWVNARKGRLLVLNVPMVVPNEPPMGSSSSASLLRQGADGAYDQNFVTLAQRLVARGGQDTIIILGWEMNGTTYTSRCGSDPAAWVTYYRRIVAAMRSVPGARFRFDFNPVRGTHEISWAECYPGDDAVDIIGMDSYDQRPGYGFDDFLNQSDGLRAHADFAAAHGKPISFPEWGLFDFGDNPDYIQAMHSWIMNNNVAYQTITDYCPHGVWECARRNPESSATYRALFGSAN